MKISQLITVLLVCILGGAAIYYSLEQRKEYDLIVASHGGGEQVLDDQAGGLRSLRKELEAQLNKAAEERKKSIDASKEAKHTMQENRTLCQAAARRLQVAEGNLEAAKEALKAELAKIKAIQDEIDKYNDKMREYGIDISSTTNVKEMVERIKLEVDQVKQENANLIAEKEELDTLVTAAKTKTSREETNLSDLQDKQADYRETLRKNEDLYSIAAVNNHWNYVVVNVGQDSRIGLGPDHVLLVIRDGQPIATLKVTRIENGQVIADFDPKKITQGLRLEVGDTVIRRKPHGY